MDIDHSRGVYAVYCWSPKPASLFARVLSLNPSTIAHHCFSSDDVTPHDNDVTDEGTANRRDTTLWSVCPIPGPGQRGTDSFITQA